MITKQQLYRFLSPLYGDRVMPDELASIVLEETQKRPLPDVALVEGSADMKHYFKDIFKSVGEMTAKQRLRYDKDQEILEEIAQLAEYNAETVSQFNKKALEMGFLVYSDGRKLKQYLAAGSYDDAMQLLKQKCSIRLDPEEVLFRNALIQKGNELAKLSLSLHVEQFKKEMLESSGPVHIIHFYEGTKNDEISYLGSPRESEYLFSYDSSDEDDDSLSFDQTSHGIGSGVYGIGSLTDPMIENQIDKRRDNFEIVEITRPLRLYDKPVYDTLADDPGESEQLTSLSKSLQRYADEIKGLQASRRKIQKLTREDAFTQVTSSGRFPDWLKEVAGELSNFTDIKGKYSEEQIETIVLNSLKKFLGESKKSSASIVAMPINYVLKELGYNGVASMARDNFSKGHIAIDEELSSHGKILQKIPVKSYGFKARQDPMTHPLPKVKAGDMGAFKRSLESLVKSDRTSSSLDSSGESHANTNDPPHEGNFKPK